MARRILVAWAAVDFSVNNLATGADFALTLNKPDGTTSATMPEEINCIEANNGAAADGVRVRAAGQEALLVGQLSGYHGQSDCLINKGQAITLRSCFGALALGKFYISFFR